MISHNDSESDCSLKGTQCITNEPSISVKTDPYLSLLLSTHFTAVISTGPVTRV